VSELAATVRATLAALAATDRSLKRFGAAHHRYELAAPVASSLALPADLAEFLATIGASGAGPGYGFAIDRLVQADAPWRSGVAVAHLGCGYAAVVAASGEVWFDARVIGVVLPIAPSFSAWYLQWLERLAHSQLPEHVPAGVCPLPNALSGFLGLREQQLGLASGTLGGAALHEALGELGPHSIEIAAESSVLYRDGRRVDPCLACARLIENLAADGLRADVVRPGS